MAAGADFRSRISLDGGDKLVSDLKAIGTEGDKAFSTVGKSAETSATQVSAFSRASEAVSRQMSSMRNAATQVAGSFRTIGQDANEFGTALGNVANNIIPRWREVMALGTVGGAAGFFALFESTAKWGHELSINARLLGETPGTISLIAKAAKEAGVDIDHMVEGMLKFGNSVQKAADERRKLVGELSKDVFGAGSQLVGAGPEILRGGPQSKEGPLPRFLQPQSLKVSRDLLEETYAVAQKLGATQGKTLEQWIWAVQRSLAQTGPVADKVREDLNKLGANLPSRTLGEQIDKSLPGFRDMFAENNIALFDKTTGSVRKLTDVFGDFLDQFAKKSPSEQFRLVTENMGRGFTDLIPLMQKGREGLLKFFDEARARGLDTSVFDKEIASLDEAQIALNRLDSAIKGVRKSFVAPFGDVFTPMLNELGDKLREMQPQIRDFAAQTAADLKAVVLDVINVFQGGAGTTDFGKGVRMGLDAITIALGATKAAFAGLTFVITPVADALNAIFGVDYAAKTYALAAAMLYFSGILPALAAGLRLVVAAVMAMNPWVALATAIVTGAVLIYENWSKIGPLLSSLWETLKGFGAWLGNEFTAQWNSLSQIIIDALNGIGKWWGDLLRGMMQKLADAAAWIGRMLQKLGLAAGETLTSIPMPFASGGLVPGTGRGDRVSARLEPGEFVIRRSRVQELGAPFLAMLNQGMGSLLPRSGFATGGLVTAGAASGGTPVHLHLGGGNFALSGASDVVSALVVEARRHQIRSAGPKPSWYGGR